jgi:hypothetical protein
LIQRARVRFYIAWIFCLQFAVMSGRPVDEEVPEAGEDASFDVSPGDWRLQGSEIALNRCLALFACLRPLETIRAAALALAACCRGLAAVDGIWQQSAGRGIAGEALLQGCAAAAGFAAATAAWRNSYWLGSLCGCHLLRLALAAISEQDGGPVFGIH